jgi:hypothetical protein
MNKKALILVSILIATLVLWMLKSRFSNSWSTNKIIAKSKQEFRLTQEFLATIDLLSRKYSINLWTPAGTNHSSNGFILRSTPFSSFYIAVNIRSPSEILGNLSGYKVCRLSDRLTVLSKLSSFDCKSFEQTIKQLAEGYPAFDLQLILYPKSVQLQNNCLIFYSKNPRTNYIIVSLLCNSSAQLNSNLRKIKQLYSKLLERNVSEILTINGTKASMALLYFVPTTKF